MLEREEKGEDVGSSSSCCSSSSSSSNGGGGGGEHHSPLGDILHPTLLNDSSTGKPVGLPVWQPERRPVFTPYPAKAIPTVDAGIAPLFQSLSPDTIRTLLTAVLLERPVILRSHSRSLMVVCAEAIRKLLFPFHLMTPYHPLLPLSELCSFWEDIKAEANAPSW